MDQNILWSYGSHCPTVPQIKMGSKLCFRFNDYIVTRKCLWDAPVFFHSFWGHWAWIETFWGVIGPMPNCTTNKNLTKLYCSRFTNYPVTEKCLQDATVWFIVCQNFQSMSLLQVCLEYTFRGNLPRSLQSEQCFGGRGTMNTLESTHANPNKLKKRGTLDSSPIT